MSNSRDHRCRLSPIQEQQLVAAYHSGKTLKEAAEPFGYTVAGAWHMLRRLGVPVRSNSAACKLRIARDGARITRKYTVNEDYFAKADTPEVVRWVGFIAADGCISEKPDGGKQLIVQLQAGDKAHLESLATALSYDGPITQVHKDNSVMARIAVCCAKMCDDLIGLGVTPRKSKSLKPWNGDPEMERFWFGGYMDGDGTVCKVKKGWHLGLVSGSSAVVEAWSAFAFKHTGNKKAPSLNRGVWGCNYSGVTTPKLLARLLYDDLQGSAPLARKKSAADLLLATKSKDRYVQPFRWGTISLDELEQRKSELGSLRATANFYGATTKSLRSRLGYLRAKLCN